MDLPLRLVLPLAVLVLGSFLALLGLQWKHGLGSFTTNPQEVELALGGPGALLAGGRGLLRFQAVEAETGHFRLICGHERLEPSLPLYRAQADFCGLELTLLDLWVPEDGEYPWKARVEARW